jgi:hypothetical protein
LTGKSYHAEQECGIGQTVHQPARGDSGQPGANQRNTLAAEKETIVSMLQCPKDQLQAFVMIIAVVIRVFHLADKLLYLSGNFMR